MTEFRLNSISFIALTSGCVQLGVALFRGYGFVQMDSQEAAHKAVLAENGSLLKGNRIGMLIRFNVLRIALLSGLQ